MNTSGHQQTEKQLERAVELLTSLLGVSQLPRDNWKEHEREVLRDVREFLKEFVPTGT